MRLRNQLFREKTLLTKNLRFKGVVPIPNPIATFTPEQDYWLTGMDVHCFANGGSADRGFIAVTYSSDPTQFNTVGTSGTTIVELQIGFDGVDRTYNWIPYGFFLESRRAISVFVSTSLATVLPTGAVAFYGNVVMFLLPCKTGGK